MTVNRWVIGSAGASPSQFGRYVSTERKYSGRCSRERREGRDVDGGCPVPYDFFVDASQIIKEIEALSPEEQAKVVRFAYQLDAERRLTGPELSSLAERMVASADPAERATLRDAIVRGFYGGTARA